MINTINAALGVEPVPSSTLGRAFEGWWPDFEKLVKAMPEVGEAVVVKRSTEDLLSEVTETTRAQTDLVRAMQTQITHVEQTLFRAPFGDGGIIYSNSFKSGRTMPLSSLAGNIPFTPTGSITANAFLVDPPEAIKSADELYQFTPRSKKDEK
jgi:hypothetical protein